MGGIEVGQLRHQLPGPAFETDVLAGFVLARAAARLSDNTIRSDVLHLEQLRAWFGGPLWDMEPADADAYFGRCRGMRRRALGWPARRRSGRISCSLR